MQALLEFFGKETIKLNGDLQITGQNITLKFEWTDTDNEIIFPKAPLGGRHLNLWQQTCFEAFVQTASGYFEFNLSTNGAWNVYHFNSYRFPQPPAEYAGARLLDFNFAQQKIEARFLIPETDFSNVKAGLTAVLLLTQGRTTYWSLKHSGPKPDFHLSENFILERNNNV